MSTGIVQEYLSIGGNKHSAASSWSKKSGVFAFGADQNVAICHLTGNDPPAIKQLTHGHAEKVTAVAFVNPPNNEPTEILISGSADGKLLTRSKDDEETVWKQGAEVTAHRGAVNCIATLAGSDYFVTGGSDAKIKVWKINGSDVVDVLTIAPKPRIMPLTLVLGACPGSSPHDDMFLAVGGTRNDIQVYSIQQLSSQPKAEHQATLTGHEGWVRSLCLRAVNKRQSLLASASHDKYVRLWRFDLDGAQPPRSGTDSDQVSFQQTLTAKAHKVSVGQQQYSITFEALLLGHEDWIYSAAWNPNPESVQLLTASADGSLTIWESDPTSGIWISVSRLGEISGQKGATTATGSAGGFWTGVWSPDGRSVTCLGRTGSWRIWTFDKDQQYWVQKSGLSGHVGSANGLAWSPEGGYLLSTSSDQTTRLHAEWKTGSKRTWHEFSRPQIHGYDLNCISTINDYQFTSGADEKLLRVFNEPRDVANVLESLCGIERPSDSILPDAASMPVLGLSNKAMTDDDDEAGQGSGNQPQENGLSSADQSVIQFNAPPTEDVLARHTLWPEHEKLYGHGYEISESAYSPQNQVLATACKASSIDHAVIRLYNTENWNEIKPPLVAHSLTVTRLAWSHHPDNFLLSVGRDRQWAVFGPSSNENVGWNLLASNPRAHTRMILDAAWSPVGGRHFFATAGRDKMVKLWYCGHLEPGEDLKFAERSIIKRESAVTALDFVSSNTSGYVALAVGEESGAVSLHLYNLDQDLSLCKSVEVDRESCPAEAITRMTWRPSPNKHQSSDGSVHLAIAAADGSVRILAVDIEGLVNQVTKS